MRGFHEENHGVFEDEWININELFDQAESTLTIYAKYNIRPLPRVKVKTKTNDKLELHINFASIEISTEVIARDGLGQDSLESLV